MPDTLFRDFRDENALSQYPFSDTSDLVSTDGFTLAPDIFVDASLYPIGGRAQLTITKIAISLQIVTITIGDPFTANLATASFSLQDLQEIITFTDAYGRPAGILVADVLTLAMLQSWPAGEHKFLKGSAEFVASCCVPQPAPGVRGILTETGDLFTGDVYLIGEDGVILREVGDGVIQVDVVGDPLFVRRTCDPVALFATPRFLKTLNNIPPDEYGNFSIDVAADQVDAPAMRIYAQNERTLVFEMTGSTLENG